MMAGMASLALVLVVPLAGSSPQVSLTEIFAAGEKNPHGLSVVGYRIPGFLAVPSNTSGGDDLLLAVAEARKYSCSDASPHDLAGKRSTDGGRSWSAQQLIVEPGVVWGKQEGGEKGGAVYDPTPVYDAVTGAVHIFFSYCPSRFMSRPKIPQAFEMWMVSSTDRGLSWAAPKNLSAVPTPANEAPWCQRTAGGGGNGIQLQQGPHKGRLVIPGYHNHCPTPPPPPTPDPSCTKAKAEAEAAKWCNRPGSWCDATGTRVPLLGESASSKTKEWRCYSPTCLTPDHKAYKSGSGCIEYCTENSQLRGIMADCKPGPAPAPPRSESYSHVLYSDNHGAEGSWKYSASFQPGGAEGSVAEVGAGELLYIARLESGAVCTNPKIGHCAGMIRSATSGATWDASTDVDSGQLPDPACKNTVAKCARGLVHAGSHSVSARTNVSALFSSDQGHSWGGEVMIWEAPKVGGYSTVQGYKQAGADRVGVVFENRTCSITIGSFAV